MKEVRTAGVTLQMDEVRVNDIEIYDLINQIESKKLLAVPKLIDKLLDEEQKQAVYAAIRTDDGRVPLDAVMTCLKEIIEGLGKN